MAERTIQTRIMLKHDTAENWANTSVENKGANLVLKSGELAYDSTNKYIKFGDGEHKYSELPFIRISAANVDGLSDANTDTLYKLQVSDNQLSISILSADKTGATYTTVETYALKDWTSEISAAEARALSNANAYTNNAKAEAISATQNAVYVETDLTAVTSYKADATKNIGDILINKKTIAAGKFEHTAYVWNGTDWAAMDGNYSAENVYFKEDIKLAGDYTAVGNIKLSDSRLPATGKSVKTLMENIFTKELSGSIKTNPSVTGTTLIAKVNGTGNLVTASQNYEYGTYLTDIEFSGALFTKGSYTYGPTSEQSVTAWTTTATNGVSVASGASATSGTLESIVIGDSGKDTDNELLSAYTTVGSVQVTTTGAYAVDTVEAKTNLGNTNTEAGFTKVQIAANSKSASSGTFAGYRKCFWGYRLESEGALNIEALTSGNIRNDIHAETGTSLPNTTQSNKETNFTVPANTKQIILVCPHDTLTKKIKVFNNSSLGAPMDFDNSNARIENAVSVEGANGYTAKAYDLWYVTFPAKLEVSTNLAVTWA